MKIRVLAGPLLSAALTNILTVTWTQGSPYRQVRIAAESRRRGYAIPMRNALGLAEHDGKGVRYTDPLICLAGGCEQSSVASHLTGRFCRVSLLGWSLSTVYLL